MDLDEEALCRRQGEDEKRMMSLSRRKKREGKFEQKVAKVAKR